MSQGPLSVVTVEAPQILRLPIAIRRELGLADRPSSLLFLESFEIGFSARTLDDLIENMLVPRIALPSSRLSVGFSSSSQVPWIGTDALFEELLTLAGEILSRPQASLRSDGSLEIPDSAFRLAASRRFRLEIIRRHNYPRLLIYPEETQEV
jgi:hypothetical protein